MKKRIAALGASLLMAFALTACTPSTVEEYYTQDEVKESVDAQIEVMKADYIGIFSDMGYTVEENTFTYWFKFAEQVEDVDTAAQELKDSISEETLQDIVRNVQKECGISEVTGSYLYYNADGSVILEHSYTYTAPVEE